MHKKNPMKRCSEKSRDFKVYSYHFLPEESDKLGCHTGVIQVTLSLTHDNSQVVDWCISIFRVADPTQLNYLLVDF